MKKLVPIFILCLILIAPAAQSATAIPDGYRTTTEKTIFPGLEHILLTRGDPDQIVNAATITPGAEVALVPVTSNDWIAGPEPRSERTSSMCQRISCLVAVNGDFFDLQQRWSLGGMVANGELKKTPNPSHHQLNIGTDGKLWAGQFEWNGTLVTTDLRDFQLTGANIPRETDAAILYTPAWGPTTETNGYGHELVAEIVEPDGPIRLNQTSRIKMIDFRVAQGDSAIPANGLVISAHGVAADRLASMWKAVEAQDASRYALLRLESPADLAASIGGTPILVKDGRRWFADEASSFVRGRHPRTAVGWNQEGYIWLVTVDGRQSGYSAGMTLAELADLMISLGATDAINLDGGGSTTFVVGGSVVNRPSDRAVRKNGSSQVAHLPDRFDRVLGNVERPVADALAVVPVSGEAAESTDPLRSDVDLPPVDVPFQIPLDPASDPISAMPVLLPQNNVNDLLAAFALAFHMAVGAALLTKKLVR